MATDVQFQTLTVRRGQDAVVTVTMTPVVNVTGYGLRFAVRRYPGGTDLPAVLTKDTVTGGVVITNGPGGVFDVVLGDDDTESPLLPAGRYAWDVWRTDPGSESQLCGGDFFVLERPLLSTLGRLRAHLGATSTAEDFVLMQILGQADRAVKELLGWDPTPRDGVVGYHDGTGTEVVVLPPVVRAVTEVRVDPEGHYGLRAGAFDATTVLTPGTQYALGGGRPGEPFARAGLLWRYGDVWPYRWLRRRGLLAGQRVANPGAVKVTADYGFAVVPEDLELAVLQVAARVRQSRRFGLLPLSESYEGYSYSLAAAVRAEAQAGDVAATIARWREFVLW